MAACPKCSAPIADDFGLTECGACKAQLLVHIDGTVEFSDSGAAPGEPPGAVYAEDIGADEAFDALPIDEPATLDEPYAELEFEAGLAQVDDAAAEPEVLFEEADPVTEDVATVIDDPYPDFDEPEAALPPGDAYVLSGDSPDLSDIAAFGNSEVAGAREGSLRYSVRISGIDTADVREAFREALTDRKFVWDTDQILRSIHDGSCVIEAITATKAHVLINRLRSLNVRVDWEQRAIHQA